MKPIDKEIYDILNEYLFDISKVGYFKNERGIEIASFDDNSSNYKIYMELLKKIGFERVYLNELNGEEYLMSKKYLCSISFCEAFNFISLIQFSPNKPFEVGDQTMRGKIVEIDKKGKWIKTKGSWGNGEEIKKWTDLENVIYSPDWSALHTMEDAIKQQLNIARNLLYGEEIGQNGFWGIYNEKVDESCREAYNMMTFNGILFNCSSVILLMSWAVFIISISSWSLKVS